MERVAAGPAVEGSTAYVAFVSVVAATSGLLFGFDISVINGALLFIRQQFALSEIQTEVAASSLLAGCVVGASIGGWLSDRFGRRGILLLSAVLFAFSSIAAALPRQLPEFVVARLAGGVAIGIASLLAPLYIAEVSPARLRGRLVSLNQMAIVTGILLAYFVNWILSYQGPSAWRWMFAVAAVPSIAFFVALFFVPESPRWLAERSRTSEAMSILVRINGRAEAARSMAEIQSTIAEESGSLSELFEPRFRRALIVALVLAVMQQWTGINTVLFYGSIIFRERLGGASESSAIGANVAIGAVNFAATIVALWLIDREGRKPLLVGSAVGMAVCLSGMAAVFLGNPPSAPLALTLMLACAAAFAIGMGPGVWVVLSEIFPNRIRGRAMSVATVSLWGACTILTFTFLSLARAIGISGAFLLYAAMCVFTAAFVCKALPETKGRTLEEIERDWRKYSR